ncbi:MAG: HipA N-terminal domain-containing protein [Oleispira sp.]|nr:HipA N-terminal domain-containing protein [Oleispira sp.]MBL4880578.1 HipA N-terminal domain-containing protein [Oleispira sp.]
MRQALVHYNGRIAGTIRETTAGFEFQYDTAYLAGGVPISFNYPLQEEAFYYAEFPSFFENLAAEGWMRKLQSREQHIDEADPLGLLLANGRDLTGAVTITALQE